MKTPPAPAKRAVALAAALALGALASCSSNGPAKTATPIQHLVVIFGENVSFDHYFGTYPSALNPPGEPRFTAAPGTPSINGLTPDLLKNNPNSHNPINGTLASNPFRIGRAQAGTASQNHNYTMEQLAYDNGRADAFPWFTGAGTIGGVGAFGAPSLVMGYFDGNTVTALWNYAQHFAMNDNAYSDQYGPSSPGALNLIAGQTNGITVVRAQDSTVFVHDGQGGFTLTNDAGPAGDLCTDSTYEVAYQVRASGRNVGDLLNDAGVSWGWFQGGFDLTMPNDHGVKGCSRMTVSHYAPGVSTDYISHHQPFQYYASTANPTHARPASTSAIGRAGDAANHQYDIHDFFDALNAGNFPAVSFLKAAAFQDGHAGYSDPLDEQAFIVQVVNYLMQRPDWKNTAVIILYDDSDGWYDHRYAPPTNGSFDPHADRLTAQGACGVKGTTPQLGGPAGSGPVNGRCGPGTRQPFLVISPWAKMNYVDTTLIRQSSVLRFIEDNWLQGKRLGGGSFDATAATINGMLDLAGSGTAPTLFLDDTLGIPVSTPSKRLPR